MEFKVGYWYKYIYTGKQYKCVDIEYNIFGFDYAELEYFDLWCMDDYNLFKESNIDLINKLKLRMILDV